MIKILFNRDSVSRIFKTKKTFRESKMVLNIFKLYDSKN